MKQETLVSPRLDPAEAVISGIQRLKAKKNAIILAHNYQRPEIQDIADYVGDSLELSRLVPDTRDKIIVFCGVRFMAETAKILSPEKTVLLPRIEAGCPMADMVTAQQVRELKKQYPDAVVVSYVNTNADVKAETDVCCTSANAVKVIQNIPARQIIFLPDKNLADYVKRFTDKEIIPWNGFCQVHERISPEAARKAKETHPDAKIIVHPECRKEVIDLADLVLSTGGMVKFASETSADTIIIGTEEGIIYRLKKANPSKSFYTLGPARMCRSMKFITLEDVLIALEEEKYNIELPEDIMTKARKAFDKMLTYM